jgi:hypothetical protein
LYAPNWISTYSLCEYAIFTPSDITIINLFHFAVNQEIRNPCYLVTSICTRCSVSRSAKHGIVCLDNIVRSTYVYIAELLIGVKIAYSHNEYVDIQFGAYNAFYFLYCLSKQFHV